MAGGEAPSPASAGAGSARPTSPGRGARAAPRPDRGDWLREGGYDAGRGFAALGFSDTDSELPSQINGLGAQSYVPERVASATLGLRLFDERMALGGRWFHVSESHIGEINAPPSGDAWEPGYNLVDVFSNFRFGNGNELRLNVSNVGDKVFTPALGTPAAGNSVDTGRGRTFAVSMKIAF